MTLFQLPDDARSDLGSVQCIATDAANYSMNQFVIVTDSYSGRTYFGMITGPQRNINRSGLGQFDNTTITALEAVVQGQYGREAVVSECFLYDVRLLRDVSTGTPEVVTRRPQINSIAVAATEEEVIKYMNLPEANPETIVGTIPGTEIGIYYDHKRLVYHSLLAGATGSGKSNAGANIIKASVNMGFGCVVYDHKPDYQDMEKLNADLAEDDPNQQPMDVEYWYLGRQPNSNGHTITIPASCFSPAMLAATIFWNDGEMQQREEMEHGLEIFREQMRDDDPDAVWTLNDWYWWFTNNQGGAASTADVQQMVGHAPNQRTLQALLRKVTRRNRRPSWLDGINIGSRSDQPSTGGVMGRKSGYRKPVWFDPVDKIQKGKVLCIKINGSEAGREYGLFLDFMLKRVYRARANREIKFPVHHFIDEAQDIFGGSKRFAEAAGGSMSQQIRKGRSLNIAFTIAVQSAEQVPSEILNNLNSRLILRHNNAGQARSALEKATPEQLASTAYFGPGQALVDLFGSNAVVQSQMLRSPFQLTVDTVMEDEE